LREQTQAEHAAIERTLDLLRPDLTLERYTAVLHAFLGFYRPLEAKLCSIIAPAFPAWDLHSRLKHPLLERDLHALAGDTSRAAGREADGEALPDLRNVPAALGCMYVMEGATLGGQFITRQVCPRLGLDAAHGGAFFNGYGADTGRRWRDFQEFLISHSVASDATGIVAAARDTFASLDAWFQSHPGACPSTSASA
jgi:heme oxygenase